MGLPWGGSRIRRRRSTGARVTDQERARTEREKMLAGELYDAGDPALQTELAATHRWLVRYNAALGASASERRELLLERLAAVGGGGAVVRPPFSLRLRLQHQSRRRRFPKLQLRDPRRCRGQHWRQNANRSGSPNPCGIHAIRRDWSSAVPFALAAMSGSAEAPSFCRV
jgi:hypothetical protein